MVQTKLDSPMPWIGMYIAAASAAISLAMAADLLKGFRSKKLWFPCKYFCLNAFSLTLLAVALKLPVDLTDRMKEFNETLARVSSLLFMSTAMGNFTISLGSMGNNEIMLNLAALGILVITIAGNVFIRMSGMHSISVVCEVVGEEIGSTVLLFFLLLTLCSVAIMVPTAKKTIESVYQEMHRRSVLNKKVEWGKFTFEELTTVVRRYWVMAQTGSPQFVIARSVACATSGIMCLSVALTLSEAWMRISLWYGVPSYEDKTFSKYKWSINWILIVQSIAVALGTIAPVFRWFIAAKFKSLEIGRKSFKHELKVETHWTQMLVDWRDRPLPLQIQHPNLKKPLHEAKRLVLHFCIGIQIVIVLAGKIVLLISATCAKVILFCFHHIKNSKVYDYEESMAQVDLELSRYVVLLEGEAELPKKTLTNICNEVDKLIQIGKKKQPKNLIELLKKSVNFKGVTEFDSLGVPSLCSPEPPNCWSLPIVTLTSIAIALPNITGHKSDQLLRGVSEGLYFAKLVEKALDRNGELTSIRNTADVVWVRVELYRKWQDISLKSRIYKNTLQELSDIAEKTVTCFKTDVGDLLRENPPSWPVKVIAANSMYRISRTIMQADKDNDRQTEEELFERLSVIISDILVACLTNLVRVITFKCHSSGSKEREENVRQAALLLGESQQILEMLQQRELPSLDPEKAAYIDEWRAFMEQDNENPVASVSAPSTTIPQSNGEHVIELEG